MTKAQSRYLVAIRDFIKEHSYSPSYAEIARLVGVRSLCSVHRAVHRLIRQGHLMQGDGFSRTLQPVPDKVRGMQSCRHSHPPVWFFSMVCPLCFALKEIRAMKSKSPQGISLEGE